MPIMSEEYQSEEKLSVLSVFKFCVLPENLCLHSGSSQIVKAENSQIVTRTYENQSINLNFKSLSEGMSYNVYNSV